MEVEESYFVGCDDCLGTGFLNEKMDWKCYKCKGKGKIEKTVVLWASEDDNGK